MMFYPHHVEDIHNFRFKCLHIAENIDDVPTQYFCCQNVAIPLAENSTQSVSDLVSVGVNCAGTYYTIVLNHTAAPSLLANCAVPPEQEGTKGKQVYSLNGNSRLATTWQVAVNGVKQAYGKSNCWSSYQGRTYGLLTGLKCSLNSFATTNCGVYMVIDSSDASRRSIGFLGLFYPMLFIFMSNILY
jgi:hypothetical protein